MRFLPFLLPIAALLIVGAAVAGATLFDDDDGNRPAVVEVTPTAETPPALRPALEPGQTVCGGLLTVPVPGEPRTFPEVYTQRVEVNGFTVVASAEVSPLALEEARKTIERVFANEELAEPLVRYGAYVIVAAKGVGVLDLPEFACLEGQLGADFFTHVCGIADRADYPVATVNEADLLGDPDGPCGGLNILYHELGHLIQGWSLAPADYIDVRLLYQDALNAGTYRNDYAATNTNEYFAEGTQAYFLSTDPAGIRNAEWLERYDPELFALLEGVYNP